MNHARPSFCNFSHLVQRSCIWLKKWRAWGLGYYELTCSRLGGRIESTFYYALLVEYVVRDAVGDQSCNLHLNLPPRFSLEVPTCVLVQHCLAPETESTVHSSHHAIPYVKSCILFSCIKALPPPPPSSLPCIYQVVPCGEYYHTALTLYLNHSQKPLFVYLLLRDSRGKDVCLVILYLTRDYLCTDHP